MITEPGAAMLDTKFFVSRLDGAFPDLYERWWDGDEWIWVNHGRPGGVPVTGTPGAAMMNEKLFVVVDDGSLWERHWHNDLGRWAWNDHGRPADHPIVHGPGAAMMDEKLFVVTDDGKLWERHWRNDLGRWAWEDHGRPANHPIVHCPGAAMMDEKLFVVTDHGHLWERHWRSDLGRWAWEDHGTPPGTSISTAPGAAMMNRKLFVGTSNGHLFERFWDGSQWVWVDHGTPPGTGVATAPGAAMMNSKLFVGTADGRLFERFWDGAQWAWVNHGTALHDQAQHVVGTPGTDPKLTILIMGDGYSEADMNAYRNAVDSMVLGALRLDQLENHQSALRIVRVDLVSVESGVRERRYNEAGEITSDVFKLSRLGIIPNDNWGRCWFDHSDFTDARIEKLRQRLDPDANHVVILVKSGTWGGCSSTGAGVAVFTEGSGKMTIAHEMGHNLFLLDDEYVNDSRNFTDVSTRANTTERLADWTTLKWHGLVSAGTPLPTDAAHTPKGWNRRTSVGAFEGAGGWYSTGLFRPVLECRMNQNNPPWCPVCGQKIASDLEVFE
jgi:hypothetical protein